MILAMRRVLGALGRLLGASAPVPAEDSVDLTGRVYDHTRRAWGDNLEALRALDPYGSRIVVAGHHPRLHLEKLYVDPIDFEPGDVLLIPGDFRIPPFSDGVVSVPGRQLSSPEPLRAKVLKFERPRGALGRVNPPDQWFGEIEVLGPKEAFDAAAADR